MDKASQFIFICDIAVKAWAPTNARGLGWVRADKIAWVGDSLLQSATRLPETLSASEAAKIWISTILNNNGHKPAEWIAGAKSRPVEDA